EDQGFIERNPRDRTYTRMYRPGTLDLSAHDAVREQKLQELNDIQTYAVQRQCSMGYLTTYLGDQPGYTCGTCSSCQPKNFPLITPSQRIQEAVGRFLDQEWLPSIEKRGTVKSPVHENGWSLSYHGSGRIGKLVRASKYEGAGPFPAELVTRAAEVIRGRYPIQAIDAIVSVPPTKSGMLVEDFALQVAALLHKPYLPIITKIGKTLEQKELKNRLQKEDNVNGAFSVENPAEITARTLVLIDDIYDSGCIIKEVGRTLMLAGARAVYPFTITRTMHSDDQ
ncbi:MAG TPA: RecQ family zinc-binding domain-containing protein, partial [Ktedonobacteraceae bacterium]